jgi:hypothetical protein
MYQLNAAAAKEAEQFSSQITEIGKYVGKFTQAYHVDAKSGAKGIHLEFESDNKQTANFTLYTTNKDGEPIFGYKQLMALMTCFKIKNLSPTDGKISAYDYDLKEKVIKDGSVFNDLVNNQIGLLIETEEYENSSGELKIKPVIKAFFQASTELMATEILNSETKPVQLEKVVATLRHRPLKAKAKPSNVSAVAIEDLDSNIPF